MNERQQGDTGLIVLVGVLLIWTKGGRVDIESSVARRTIMIVFVP